MPTPRRGCILTLFYTLNLVTVITALCVAASLIVELALSSELSAVEIVIRIYGVAFSFVIVFAELEWPIFMRESNTFKSWPLRGALYTFIGLLAMEFSNFNENDFVKFYDHVVGWIMVGIGVFYFLLGITCMRRVREKKLTHYHAVCAANAAMDDAIAEQTSTRSADSKQGLT